MMHECDSPTDKTPLVIPKLSRQFPDVHARRDPKFPSHMIPILIVVMLERFTYYSVVVNLFLFFKDKVYINESTTSSAHASASVLGMIGVSWLFCVFGGVLSDLKLGKSKTLVFGLFFYVVGVGLLVASAFAIQQCKVKSTLNRALMVVGSLLVTSFGEGAYKANIAAFGGEQLDNPDQISTRRYFDLYYFCLNIGSLLALSLTVHIRIVHGFAIAFALAFGAILLALIVFIVARNQYRSLVHQQVIAKICQIIKEGKDNYKQLHSSANTLSVQPGNSWLEYAMLKNGGSFLDWEVDEVKCLFAVIPVFLLLIPYQTIYNQIYATFLDQGVHMKLSLGSFKIQPAYLLFFDTVIVLVMVPLLEKFIYPWLSKQGYTMAPLTRITIGCLFACLAIITAGFVEIFVIADLKNKKNVGQIVNNISITAAQLPVVYQMPQFLLVGLSEVFGMVGALHFAYSGAPKSMRSIVMSFYFAISSFGSLLGSALVEVCEATSIIKIEGGLKHHDLTYYFFLLGALMFICWIIFAIFVTKRERNRRKRQRDARNKIFEPGS